MAEEKPSLKTYTLEDISKHNNKDSLWLLIDNKVYDVTEFQEEHPGGEEPLLGEAGKDATEQFNAVGHSSDAKELMKEYRIGELCEEDRKVISAKPSEYCNKCFWMKILVPVGVVLTAMVVYKTYVHYHK